MSYRFTGMDSSASSAGFACKVALEDGHDRIVLAGAPLVDAAGHFSRGAWLTELGIPAGADQFKIGFEKSIPFFAGRVRSLSGWTKEKLGEPSPEWLAQAAVRKGTQA